MHSHSKFASLPRIVAADLLAGRKIPFCVTWQWNKAASDLSALLDQFDSAHAETGVRPASISINPGLHSLGSKPLSTPSTLSSPALQGYSAAAAAAATVVVAGWLRLPASRASCT